MKHAIYYTVLLAISLACNKQNEISGPINVPDALFTYTAEGDGIPCVIFTGSENIGHKLFPQELREKFIFIHADPGNIDSAMVNDISLDDIVNDIEKLRQSLGIDKIAIMGHSMFGILPLEYAIRYPENISYAISTGAFPYTTEEYSFATQEYWESEASVERKSIRTKNLEELQKVDMSNLSQSQQFVNLYTAETPYRFHDPFFDMTELWEGVEINMNFLDHFWGNLMEDFNNTDNYKKIQSPVLIVAGKYDFGCPYYLWEDLKNIIPNFTLKVYENAGHNPMLEIPDEFTKDLLVWVKNQPVDIDKVGFPE